MKWQNSVLDVSPRSFRISVDSVEQVLQMICADDLLVLLLLMTEMLVLHILRYEDKICIFWYPHVTLQVEISYKLWER